jgi:glyoxylase-like metal-dependent hydrolase (beta-lactamase superfamily II)
MTQDPYKAADDFSSSTDGMFRPLVAEAPTFNDPREIGSGLWWVRLPLPGALDHVNVYVLEGDSGWTLVDTGSNTDACRHGLEQLFNDPRFNRLPLQQVIVTHFHPDHVGLAGWLCEHGVPLLTTRTCWFSTRLLQLDDLQTPRAEQVEFLERAGVASLELESYRRRPPSNYPRLVTCPPLSYTRIKQGDQLRIGSRCWTVHVGHGHAAEHATLWSDDGFALLGDQVLPSIASNLSVHPSEPQADLVSEWFESCQRLGDLAYDELRCLPGHGLPFYGLRQRCQQLINNQRLALERLFDYLSAPRTAVECLTAVYRRPLQASERNVLLAETVGYLNHLQARGVVRCERVGAANRWLRTVSQLADASPPAALESLRPSATATATTTTLVPQPHTARTSQPTPRSTNRQRNSS